MRRRELVHRLKVVRAQHEDDERQRRVDLDPLLEPDASVAPRLEGIVPHGASAVQAVLDDANVVTRCHERMFHDTGPARRERPPLPRVRNDAPRQRVGVDQNLLHACRPQSQSQSQRFEVGSWRSTVCLSA